MSAALDAEAVRVLGELAGSVSERMTAHLLEAGLTREAAEKTAATIVGYLARPLERVAVESRQNKGLVQGSAAVMAVLEGALIACVVLARGVDWREAQARGRN